MVRPESLEVFKQFDEERAVSECGTVPHNDQLSFCTRQCNVHPAGIREKANFSFAIGTHQRNQHSFLLAALKPIDRVDFQVFDLAMIA